MSQLIQSIENVLPTLESIREEIIQAKVTKGNKARLDKAYTTLVDSICALHSVAYSEHQLTSNPTYRNACEILFPEDFAAVGGAK